MSQEKSWLGKILASILGLFASKWPEFVAKLFTKIPDEVKEKVSLAVKIVQNIKAFIDSPAADLITSVIPGNVDDNIKIWLRKVLPVILEKYHLDGGSALSPEESHSIATNITQELTGLSFGQSALTTEVVYQSMKESPI
ncbi:MAG: hypothetical protein V4608_14860 [Bacteroidota bacterium]